MGTFADYIENKMLNLVFGLTAFTPASHLYFGLSTADPLDTGLGIAEPAGNGYARVEVDNDKTTFTVSTAGSLMNDIEITFPEASGSWGTITHFFISDADEGGNIYGHGALGTSRTVGNGDAPWFDAGDLVVSLS